MYKDANYKQKYADLKEWMPSIIDAIKKDLKNEHLKKDLYFVKQFLGSKNIHKLTTDELVEAYSNAIHDQESGEAVAEFVTSRWLLKNSELYEFFERELTQINPEFSAIEQLDEKKSQELVNQSSKQFSAPRTYIFSVLNSVVFPESVFTQLKEKAQKESQQEEQQQVEQSEKLTLENMQKSNEREMARVKDKYEKKLAGMQKKYVTDTEALKKQIAMLQRKLQEKA